MSHTRTRAATPRNREEEVADFKDRVFSGFDLLQFFDEVGVGVGATMYRVQRAEIQSEQHSEVRSLTFAHDLRVQDVEEALMQLMGAKRTPHTRSIAR